MAPKAMKSMKAMKGATSITKGALAEAAATSTGLKKSECIKVLNSLAEIFPKELKKTGKVTLLGVCMGDGRAPRNNQEGALADFLSSWRK